MQTADLETPALVYDEGRILHHLDLLASVRKTSRINVLYSIKAMPLVGLLELITPYVDGFSVSSLFEAQLARKILHQRGGQEGCIHITTPGLKPNEIAAIAQQSSAISFNSLEQFDRLKAVVTGKALTGIRVNPECSFVKDDRYNPCRPCSKLGVPLSELKSHVDRLTGQVEGLHFHNLFGSQTLAPLRATINAIESKLGSWLDTLKWVNCGGGYLIENSAGAAELADILGSFRARHDFEIFIEPGNTVVGSAGVLVSRVIDVFQRDGTPIAVLDTGVHHLPEVFEYQRSPILREYDPGGAYHYLLAGSSCLAGDIFGEYRLTASLKPGDQVTFEHVGAYSLVKASRFNGHDLPSVYLRGTNGQLRLLKRYGYEYFEAQWGKDECADSNAIESPLSV